MRSGYSPGSAFLTAVATSAGRVLAVPVTQLRLVMAQEPGISDLILRTFLLRHSLLMRRGSGLTLIGSQFDPDTRRLLGVLARHRLVSSWLDLEAAPEAEAMIRDLDLPVTDLPIVVVPGGPLLRNPGNRVLLDALGISGTEGTDPATTCDLLVVGGGPAGLSGEELATRATLQAQKFGARIKQAARAVSLSSTADGVHRVAFDDGDTVQARAIINLSKRVVARRRAARRCGAPCGS